MRKVNYICDVCHKRIEPKEELVNRKYQMFRIFDNEAYSILESVDVNSKSLDGTLLDLCDDCYKELLDFLAGRRREENVDTDTEQAEDSEQ